MGVQYPVPAAPGPLGPTGAAGNSVRSGTGVPGSGLGVPGDFYIDTTDPDVPVFYGPKLGANWGIGVPLGGGGGSLPTGDVVWEPASLQINADDGSELILGVGVGQGAQLVGPSGNTVQLISTGFVLSVNGLSLGGNAPVAYQQVPLTSPNVQDVIDALVAYALIFQAD